MILVVMNVSCVTASVCKVHASNVSKNAIAIERRELECILLLRQIKGNCALT